MPGNALACAPRSLVAVSPKFTVAAAPSSSAHSRICRRMWSRVVRNDHIGLLQTRRDFGWVCGEEKLLEAPPHGSAKKAEILSGTGGECWPGALLATTTKHLRERAEADALGPPVVAVRLAWVELGQNTEDLAHLGTFSFLFCFDFCFPFYFRFTLKFCRLYLI